MTAAKRQLLRFSFGSAVAEMCTDHLELGGFMKHVFGRFLVHETLGAATIVDHPVVWRAELDGRIYIETAFSTAVQKLEAAIEAKLLHGVADGILMHGAAVKRQGRLVLVLGPGHAGKTTVVMELTRRGYAFIGDDYVLFDADGDRLLPFPKCAVLREVVGELPPGTHHVLPGHPSRWSFFMPDDSVGLEPKPVDDMSILFVRHRPGGPTTIRKSQVGETAARLLQHVYDLEGRESTCWKGLSSIAVKADAYVFEYQQVQRDLDVALAAVANTL